MDLIFFLISTVVISLSGVMAPGPVTAATIAAGTRRRHAGAIIAAGHGLVEFPLMLLIIAGAAQLLESKTFQIVIGLAGGAFLLVMAGQMLWPLAKKNAATRKSSQKGPFLTGIILSAGNPYFLLWWATIGLALITKAQSLGVLAFVIFAIVHWLCDLFWLELLSLASFKGAKILGRRNMQIVLFVCAGAVFLFGAIFIYTACKALMS